MLAHPAGRCSPLLWASVRSHHEVPGPLGMTQYLWSWKTQWDWSEPCYRHIVADWKQAYCTGNSLWRTIITSYQIIRLDMSTKDNNKIKRFVEFTHSLVLPAGSLALTPWLVSEGALPVFFSLLWGLSLRWSDMTASRRLSFSLRDDNLNILTLA